MKFYVYEKFSFQFSPFGKGGKRGILRIISLIISPHPSLPKRGM